MYAFRGVGMESLVEGEPAITGEGGEDGRGGEGDGEGGGLVFGDGSGRSGGHDGGGEVEIRAALRSKVSRQNLHYATTAGVRPSITSLFCQSQSSYFDACRTWEGLSTYPATSILAWTKLAPNNLLYLLA